jgi:hypothetical protein
MALNTNVTKGSVLDYVTKTVIETPLPSLDLGELGRVLVIKKVETVTNPEIQIITDKNTTLDNLSLAFKYGLNSVGYLEQTDLDLTVDGLSDYFSVVLSGFTIDSATFDKGNVKGVVYINQETIEANPLANQDSISINYQSDSKLSIINATLYAVNMLTTNYKDLQYVSISDLVEVPSNIGEAELLKSFNINFVYFDERYGKRLALSRIGGVSGYKPYIQYKIIQELKFNDFDFVVSNKPYNNQVLKTILEQKQINYVTNNYADIVNLNSFSVANIDAGLQTWKCSVNFEILESIWFFNLIVTVR